MKRLLFPLLLSMSPALAAPAASDGQEAPSSVASWKALGLVGIDGKPFDIRKLDGHVVLVVNVASFCGYTPQYAGLQALFRKYEADGLVIVGVPSNEFGHQEPGTDREIQSFCKSQYGVTFPLLRKQEVNGPGRSPLYRWLVDSHAGGGKDIGWNFEKFLVGRDGTVIGRFPSHVIPQDRRLLAAVELALHSGT